MRAWTGTTSASSSPSRAPRASPAARATPASIESTASRRIAALETALGAKVFLRTRDGLRLSPTGTRLLERAERMAAEARALATDAADAGGQIAGTVRVATTEALAVMLVEEGILELCERYRGLVIELLGGNRPLDLTRGEADLALRVTPVREADVQVRRVVRLGFAAFAAESYARRRGAPADEHGLAGHDIVLPGGELSALPEAKWLATRPDVRVAFRSSSMPALMSAAAAGVGIGVLTDAWGLRVPGLRRLFAVDAIEPRPLWLATAPDSASRAAVKLVAERIVAILTRVAAGVPGARAGSS
ncbi:MAG: LysR family transcriptional regulator [Minicystis sp.]